MTARKFKFKAQGLTDDEKKKMEQASECARLLSETLVINSISPGAAIMGIMGVLITIFEEMDLPESLLHAYFLDLKRNVYNKEAKT